VFWTGALKYVRVPLLQLKNPMTLCLTRMRVHLERRTVATRPKGTRERQILSLLSSFVASRDLLRRFCGRKSSWRPPAMSLWHLRDYAPARRRYSRSTFALVVCRRVLTDFHKSEIPLVRKEERRRLECSHTMRRLRQSGERAYKGRRRLTRVMHQTIKNILRQVKRETRVCGTNECGTFNRAISSHLFFCSLVAEHYTMCAMIILI